METLIIGGTRNLGHLLTLDLLRAGHQVTILNRGKTPDELPAEVRRLRGDRSDPSQLKQALAGRSFDAVVDMTLYNRADADTVTQQNETLQVEDFLALLAEMAGCELRIVHISKELLEARDLLPDCSPFSDPWMSELDNRRSKEELGMQYTPLPVYLRKLIEYYTSHRPPAPPGYGRRTEELALKT